MVKISIETIGAEKFIRGFNRYAESVTDWSEAFREIEGQIMDWNRRNFEAEGTPEQFKALTARYKAWKDAHYPGRPILVLTGRMKDALTMGKTGYKSEINKMDATFGVDPQVLRYAEYQYVAGRKAIQLTEKMKSSGEAGIPGITKVLQMFAYQKYREAMR